MRATRGRVGVREHGAAGWDLATSSAGTLVALRLPPEGVAAIYGAGPDVCFAGTPCPTGGRAKPTAERQPHGTPRGGSSITG
jgi:hypothetical protein